MRNYTLYNFIILVVILLSSLQVSSDLLTGRHSSDPSLFPLNFLFGTASSSYQYEGAYLSDGKGFSNWDVFTHQPDAIIDGSNGDVAVDHYHRYLEDIDLMKSMGVNGYRFSISWARILPKGRFGDVNLAGIHFYNNLIDRLLLKGIEPFVTLNHFDIPQQLEDRYGAWLSPEIREDFGHFAEICFRFFGDRVQFWATFNEPNVLASGSYRSGIYPPSRCSHPFGNCTNGDSEREPFIAAHNMLLSHADAVHTYRTKYQNEQGGSIGIVMHAVWFEPISNSTADKLAAERAQSFFLNWFLDPIMYGKYPEEMIKILGCALPKITRNDKRRLKKSLDFIGINHYTSFYVQDCIYSTCAPGRGVSRTEGFYSLTKQRDGIPIGESTAMEWINVNPKGMGQMVNYVKERYNNMPMYITENGYGEENNHSTTEGFLQDDKRVEYMAGYLEALLTTIREGANVRGYFAWSLLDNFEWLYGYTIRFGLHHVDYTTLKRTPKRSATWYKQFIAKHKNGTTRAEI